MDTQKLTALLLHYNQTCQKDIYSLEFPDTISPKRLDQFLALCAPQVSPQEVLAICDTSFMKRAKAGFLFTADTLYGTSLKGGPIPLDGLLSISTTKSSNIQYPVFLYQDGTLRDLIISENSSLKELLPLLRRLAAAEPAECAPTEEYQSFHRYHSRELRKGITALIGEYHKTYKDLQLTSSLSETLSGKIQETYGPECRPADILSMYLSGAAEGQYALYITEYGLYTKDLKRRPYFLPFDGLIGWKPSTSLSETYLFSYANGFLLDVPLYLSGEKDQCLLALLTAIRDLYAKISQEDAQGGTRALLSSVKGWEAFLEKRRSSGLDAYRNSIFVSSTFKDMHYERDAIHEQVLPRLNRIGADYEQTVSFCDLRWGVNTADLDSDEGSKKVLQVCLNEIERCKPYMLVILGERYGWIPDRSLIEEAVADRTDFDLDDLEKSVTALEIEFGALAPTGQLDRTFFYFRTIKGNPDSVYRKEDDLHAKKLSILKERIQKLAGDRVRSYTLEWDEKAGRPVGLDQFADLVTEDLKHMLVREWASAEKLTFFEKERLSHWRLAENKALQCSARDGLILSILDRIEDGDSLIALTGPSGCGKSTIMGCLAEVARLGGAEVLPLFSAHTTGSDTALEIVQNITWFLEEKLQLSHFQEQPDADGQISEQDWLNRMEMAAALYQKKGSSKKLSKIIILVDAVDQLVADEMRNHLRFVPASLSDHVCMIFSCLDSFELPYVPVKIEVPLLTEKDRPAVIQGILSLYRRELAAPVIQAISRRNSASSPLYISLLLQRLLMMNKDDFDDIRQLGDGMDAITFHQLQLVERCPDSLSGICRELLTAASVRIGGNLVQMALSYLAVSRHGLRESDLMGILTARGEQWNSLDFSLFINYMKSLFLFREDGRYDFAHKTIREGLLERASTADGQAAPSNAQIHKDIYDWLHSLPASDPVRIQEMGFHCLETKDEAAVLSHILTCSQEERTYMARFLFLFCRKDEGRWLKNLLSHWEELGLNHDFLHFIMYDWNKAGGGITEHSALKAAVFDACLPCAQALAGNQASDTAKEDLGILYTRLGRLLRMEQDTLDAALDYYQQAHQLWQDLARETSDSKWLKNLTLSYYYLGFVYNKQGGAENRKKTYDCYLKGAAIGEGIAGEGSPAENRDAYAWLCGQLAKLYVDDNELPKAQSYFDICCQLYEELIHEDQTTKFKGYLAGFYYSYAWMCRDEQDAVNLQKALELFEKELALRKELAAENASSSRLTDLAYAYYNVGSTMVELDREARQAEALDYYEKCIPLMEDLDNRRMLPYAYTEVTDIYIALGGAENMQKADMIYRKALPLLEAVALEKDDTSSYHRWEHALHRHISHCLTDHEEVLAAQEKLISILEILVKKTGYKEYKSMLKAVRLQIKLTKLEGKFDH